MPGSALTAAVRLAAGPSSEGLGPATVGAELRWQFVLGENLSSTLIAYWGQGYGGWSHVDLLLPPPPGVPWDLSECLGARSDRVGGAPPGVQIRPPTYTPWKRRAVLRLPCTAGQASAAYAFGRLQIGMGYDKGDILGFIFGMSLMQPGHWICSALQLALAEAAGVIPHLHVTPQQCPPNMLFSILNAVGAEVVNEV